MANALDFSTSRQVVQDSRILTVKKDSSGNFIEAGNFTIGALLDKYTDPSIMSEVTQNQVALLKQYDASARSAASTATAKAEEASSYVRFTELVFSIKSDGKLHVERRTTT